MIIDARSSAQLKRHQQSLRIERVSVSFAKGKKALDDVSLIVPCGLCGILGRTGAGKTTLLRILAAEQPTGRGRIVFRDIDPRRQPEAWRALVGYLPQNFALHPAVPVCVAVEHFTLLRGFTSARERRDHIDVVLDEMELTAVRGHHVGDLSPALSRRLALAATLVGRPPLVLLDEPTVGLAPAERVAFLELVARVASTTVVLFTTSDPADIGDWCTQFVALHRGRLLLDGAPDRLRDAVRGYVWRASIPREQLAAMQSLHSVVGIESTGDVATVRVICAHPPGGGFAPVAPSLSDVYHLCVQHRAVSVAPRTNHQRA